MDSFPERLQMMTIQLPPFIIAVVLHEYAHGFIAHRWGDNTAKDAGRLTMNPIPHVDPIGTLLLPLFSMLSGINLLFGWARPVPIDPRRFKKYRAGLFWVSFAGPLMNFLLAILSAALLCMIYLWVPQTFYLYEPLIQMAGVSIQLNYWLGIFNLLPLPPLDGSKIIQSFLSPAMTLKYESVSRYSFLILIGMMYTGVLSVLATPIHFLTQLTFTLMATIFRLPV